MAEDTGRYWDFEECGWVPCPGAERVSVPDQAGPAWTAQGVAGVTGAAPGEADGVVVAPV